MAAVQQQETPPPSPSGQSDWEFDSDASEDLHWQPANINQSSKTKEATKSTPNERDTNQIRTEILHKIAKRTTEWQESEDVSRIAEFADAHKQDLGQCNRGNDTNYPTILHWIVEQQRIGNFADEFQWRAAKILILLSLRAEPDLLAEPVMETGETALHKVLSSDNSGQSMSLTQLMCSFENEVGELRDEWSKTLIKATSMPNNKGETCLHLAIKQRKFEIAMYLAKLVGPECLLQQRRREAEGQLLNDGGNTVLHDAVAYKNLELQIPDREHMRKTKCKLCFEMYQKQTQRKSQTIKLIKELTLKMPMALTMKNSSDQTPYMRSIAKTTSSIGPSDATSNCPHGLINFSKEISEYLQEMAFTIGDTQKMGEQGSDASPFENACKCFFGDNLDTDNKTPKFIHLEPICGNMLDNHPFLKFTEIMSQVHIQLISTSALEDVRTRAHKDPDLIEDESEDKNEIATWKLNMEHLDNFFKKLRDLSGVQQILKLTVVDNPIRPCSDEIIEKCLHGFDVRYLDWNKPDLCADIILAAAPNVVELTLHSSGSSSVLRGWTATNGLCNLHKLSKLIVHGHRGLDGYERYYRNITMFQCELESIMAITRARIFHKTNEQSAKAKEQKLRRKGIELPQNDIESGSQSAGLLTEEQEKLAESLAIIKEAATALETLDRNLEQLEEERKAVLSLNGKRDEEGGNQDDAKLKTFFDKVRDYGGNVLPSLFQGKQGYVVKKFEVEPKLEERPNMEDEEGTLGELGDDSMHGDFSGFVKPNQWLKVIDDFTDREVKASTQEPEIRVCLIDDGVTTTSGEFGDTIAKGWPTAAPWVGEVPFYHSSSDHGTTMARLIKRICPNVKIYVAKLGAWEESPARIEGLKQISTAEKAAKAVEWAIKQKVHIISMSWSLIKIEGNPEQTRCVEKLGTQINLAGNPENKIIMYCSARDDGMYGDHQSVFPGGSGTKGIKTIGSSNEHGKASGFVNDSEKGVDYLLPGEGIDDLKHGSSASTALAAGLAALILWCYAKQSPPDTEIKASGWQNMAKIFNGMATDNKFIDVTALFKSKEKVSAADVVHRCNKWIR